VEPGQHAVREDFRPPTQREQEIVELLLSVELPGIEALRAQLAYARVARWDCGCASFDVIVDRERAPRSSVTTSPAVEAASRERDDPANAFDLLLWVEDGWLASVELVDYVDNHGAESPAVIPPRDAWKAPRARSGAQ
jgi:hypothetical protein